MIKGKFYSGLPSEMMTRSRAVNRQETHFFWPDETDSESVSATPRSKRIVSKSTSITTNNNIDSTQSDIKPKELVRKQLSSGIQFYDNVNAKTPESRRRRFKKIDNINLNNNDIDFQPEKKKLETFSSKIEFYDFEPEFKASEKTMDKKFENKEKPVKMTNVSKSVENISKLAKNIDEDEIPEKKSEKLSTIIKEVKNLNLTSEGTRKVNDYARNERDSYYRGPDKPEPRRSNVERDYDRDYNQDYGRNQPDRYDNRGYRESEYRYRTEGRSHREPYKYNNLYDDYDDRGDTGDYGDRKYERTQRTSYSQRRDSYDYRDGPRRFEESPVRDRRSPAYDRYDYNREYEAEVRRPRNQPIRDVKPFPVRDIPRKSNDPYHEEPQNRTIRHEEDEYSTCISRKPAHIPQHLRTNILSNGRVRPQAQRPMSVRNSAVTRVGVGLPDIE